MKFEFFLQPSARPIDCALSEQPTFARPHLFALISSLFELNAAILVTLELSIGATAATCTLSSRKLRS